MGHVDDRTFAGDTFTVKHVEFGGLEGRGHLVLDHLDARTVAHRFITVLQGLDTANVKTHRGIELQSLATGSGFGITEEHADLFA